MNTMKFSENFLTAIFFSAVLFSSCEKVIDLDLKGAGKRYVIEGMVTNLQGIPSEVLLSQTRDFAAENGFNGVSNAAVTIQPEDGQTYTLTEADPGIYRTTAFVGVPGKRYTLTVTIDGNIFTSTSQMPSQLVRLDTLTVEDLSFGGSTTKTVSPSYLDPVGLGDSYRFIQYANGNLVKKVFVQNDDLSDGLRITRPFINQDSDLKSGDLVTVEMLHIDPNVYRYWYSLDQASTGDNQSATPANPVSNINGGALGYFSAHSVSTKTIRIP